MEYQHFFNIFKEILDKHAPIKRKYLIANQGRFMTKDLHKAIMKRSRLRNKILSDKTEMSQKEHKKQQNSCVNLLKKAKEAVKYYHKLLHLGCCSSPRSASDSISDNKKFCQIVKLLFSNKAKTTIKLVKKNEMIDD